MYSSYSETPAQIEARKRRILAGYHADPAPTQENELVKEARAILSTLSPTDQMKTIAAVTYLAVRDGSFFRQDRPLLSNIILAVSNVPLLLVGWYEMEIWFPYAKRKLAASQQ